MPVIVFTRKRKQFELSNLMFIQQHAIIAADDQSGSGSGIVYLFTKTGGVWSENQKFNDASTTTLDAFGRRIDMTSDAKYLLVGAPFDFSGGSNGGKGFVFISNIT